MQNDNFKTPVIYSVGLRPQEKWVINIKALKWVINITALKEYALTDKSTILD